MGKDKYGKNQKSSNCNVNSQINDEEDYNDNSNCPNNSNCIAQNNNRKRSEEPENIIQ